MVVVVVVVLTLYVFTYHDDMRSNYKKGSNFKLILFQNGFSFSVSKYVFHLIVSTLVRELLFFEKNLLTVAKKQDLKPIKQHSIQNLSL